METKIKKLLFCLRVEYGLLWLLPAVLVALYEWDILPQGWLAGDAQADYWLQVGGILLTVCLIPLSLRLFSMSLSRHVRQLPLEKALKSYRRWNEVRTALLLAPALMNISSYYWTMNTTGLLCAGMVCMASMFCVPGRIRLSKELDLPVLENKKE